MPVRGRKRHWKQRGVSPFVTSLEILKIKQSRARHATTCTTASISAVLRILNQDIIEVLDLLTTNVSWTVLRYHDVVVPEDRMYHWSQARLSATDPIFRQVTQQ